MADNLKPIDFVERSTKDFDGTTVDVATIPRNADPKDLLFGKPPGTEVEPEGEEFFKWDAEKVLDGQKGAFYVDVPNGNRTERFYGKTRTDVTRNLAVAKQNANKIITERPADKPLQPDMKLPYDPISRKQPRQLTIQEVNVISELSQTNPDKAMEMAFEARTGYTFDSMARSIEVSEQTRHEVYAAQCANDFVSAHQDFWPSAGNMLLIENWLKDRKLPVTRNNLEIAYIEQKAKLTPKPEAASAPEEFSPPPPPVSPPERPAMGEVREQEGIATRDEVAVIQNGPLDKSREAILNVFRRSRSMAR